MQCLPFIITTMALALAANSAMAASCPVPNAITNGQVADASKVMENFDAVADCAEQAVTATGTPASGSIAVISGAQTQTTGILRGTGLALESQQLHELDPSPVQDRQARAAPPISSRSSTITRAPSGRKVPCPITNMRILRISSGA